MEFLEKYNKAIVALVGTALTVLAPHFNATQGLQYLTGALTVLGVFHFRNATAEELAEDASDIFIHDERDEDDSDAEDKLANGPSQSTTAEDVPGQGFTGAPQSQTTTPPSLPIGS